MPAHCQTRCRVDAGAVPEFFSRDQVPDHLAEGVKLAVRTYAHLLCMQHLNIRASVLNNNCRDIEDCFVLLLAQGNPFSCPLPQSLGYISDISCGNSGSRERRRSPSIVMQYDACPCQNAWSVPLYV